MGLLVVWGVLLGFGLRFYFIWKYQWDFFWEEQVMFNEIQGNPWSLFKKGPVPSWETWAVELAQFWRQSTGLSPRWLMFLWQVVEISLFWKLLSVIMPPSVAFWTVWFWWISPISIGFSGLISPARYEGVLALLMWAFEKGLWWIWFLGLFFSQAIYAIFRWVTIYWGLWFFIQKRWFLGLLSLGILVLFGGILMLLDYESFELWWQKGQYLKSWPWPFFVANGIWGLMVWFVPFLDRIEWFRDWLFWRDYGSALWWFWAYGPMAGWGIVVVMIGAIYLSFRRGFSLKFPWHRFWVFWVVTAAALSVSPALMHIHFLAWFWAAWAADCWVRIQTHWLKWSQWIAGVMIVFVTIHSAIFVGRVHGQEAVGFTHEVSWIKNILKEKKFVWILADVRQKAFFEDFEKQYPKRFQVFYYPFIEGRFVDALMLKRYGVQTLILVTPWVERGFIVSRKLDFSEGNLELQQKNKFFQWQNHLNHLLGLTCRREYRTPKGTLLGYAYDVCF